MPVEMVLAPAHLPLNIYEFSSWARSTVVPLAITMAIRPTLDLPAGQAIPELYDRHDGAHSMLSGPPLHKLFYLVDRGLKFFEKHPLRELRRKAMKTAEEWILEHQEDRGLGRHPTGHGEFGDGAALSWLFPGPPGHGQRPASPGALLYRR
jgi:squalene-hopene/tetraprenyl-beta-curcumene cyclase